jgi:hypothetical protein
MGAMNTQPVKIAWVSPYAAPTVLIGENLITDASRVVVDCESGGAPKIFLEFEGKPVEDLQLEGVVHVVREVPADPIAIVVDFLSQLDPSELDRSVLQAQEMGGPQGFGETVLQILKGWASGT